MMTEKQMAAAIILAVAVGVLTYFSTRNDDDGGAV
jgi:hypothetical protein